MRFVAGVIRAGYALISVQASVALLREQLPVLLACRHGVDDQLIPAGEYQHHGFQEPRLSVETQAELAIGWSTAVERFNPERPFRSLRGIFGSNAVPEGGGVNLHAA